MKIVNEDRYVLLDNVQAVNSRRCIRLTPRTKSSKILTFITAVTIFMLVFLLIFRALQVNVLPTKINVFWISQDSLSSFKININFVEENNGTLLSGELSESCTDVSDINKFNCYPDPDSNEEGCLKRGCCWKALGVKSISLSTPFCYYPSNYVGYEIKSKTDRPDGMTLTLLRKQPSGFPKDIKNVIVNVTYLDNDRLRVKVFDPDNIRYEVPVPKIEDIGGGNITARNYEVNNEDSHLSIIRKSTGTVLFNTSLATLIFADQMLQTSIWLPSSYIYGLGESKDKLLRNINWKRYVLFNRDRSPQEDVNLYGSHPFYLVLENDGNSHGVLLFNSNSMEAVLQPTPAITFRPIGGILDFYISIGPRPGDVISQYTELIGQSFMPPYWSLGFHLCRFGYKSVKETREVWKRTRDHGIPFDTQWNDIDYMKNRNDFTIDMESFGELPQFVQEVHDADMHYMMITDPGISNAEAPGTYPPYDDGMKMDIFVKNASGELLIAKVWNTVSTVFPDFTNPKSAMYWTKQFQDFHKIVPFDGAWIDMNDPSSFVDGSIYGCPNDSSLENPPFVPGGIEPLRTHTICMTAKQYESVHYNVHNIYGTTEMIATNIALKTVLNKRPFIISRSSSPGSGSYGGIWDGDIASSWDDMQWSISSILTLNMLGISMAGADICGFNGNTTVELCARWSALGAFYPFSRNHNSLGASDQDPVALGEVVISSARNALLLRYAMLPALYTLFYRSHVYGETVARPMFFEFPHDKATYALDRQFMWGRDILILPALDEGQMEVTGYIPKGTWCPLSMNNEQKDITSKGENMTFHTPLNQTNLFLREGAILPVQMPKHTTTASRKEWFKIVVHIDEQETANGQVYWDDGETIDSYEKGLYSLIDFTVANNTFKSNPIKNGFLDLLRVNVVIIQPVFGKPNSVKRNGKEVKFEYVDDMNRLTINDIWPLLEYCEIKWK